MELLCSFLHFFTSCLVCLFLISSCIVSNVLHKIPATPFYKYYFTCFSHGSMIVSYLSLSLLFTFNLCLLWGEMSYVLLTFVVCHSINLNSSLFSSAHLSTVTAHVFIPFIKLKLFSLFTIIFLLLLKYSFLNFLSFNHVLLNYV